MRLHMRLQVRLQMRLQVRLQMRLQVRLHVRLQMRLHVRLQMRLQVRLQMRLQLRLQVRLQIRLQVRLNFPATESAESESESKERASSLEQGCRQVLKSAHLGVSGGYLGVRKPASFEKSTPYQRRGSFALHPSTLPSPSRLESRTLDR